MGKKSLNTTEQMFAGGMMLGFGLLYSINKQLTSHMQDCAKRSAAVERVGYGILIIVAAGLILNFINTRQADTTQRTTVVEEKQIKH